MAYLKKVNINNNDYFYLFHTIREGDKFRKVSKYIGKEEPSPAELDRLKMEFEAEIKNKPILEERKKPNVVAILQDLQDKEGYLSKQSMISLSKKLDIPGIDLYGVATFYSMFKLNKPGKYKVSVCTGTACHVKGSKSLLDEMQRILKVEPGETTADGLITLEAVNCIGACAKAPAIMVDDVVHGELDKKKAKAIIDRLR